MVVRDTGHATLQDLPDAPRFVINATNVQSGALWRFSKPYMWDWRVGKVANPTTELDVAVGASSAFPPVLSPARMKLNDSDFVPGTGVDLQKPPFTEDIFLTDGGGVRQSRARNGVEGLRHHPRERWRGQDVGLLLAGTIEETIDAQSSV